MSNDNIQKNELENNTSTMVFLPKQDEAMRHLLNPKVREVLLSGSAGSAKSFAGMAFAIRMILQFDGFRVGLFRKNITDTIKTTLNTLEDVMQLMNVPTEWMSFDRSTNVITFKNGSEIYLLSAEQKPSDPNFSRWGGYEFSIIIFEEAQELTQRAFDVAKSRMRYKPQSIKAYDFTHKAILMCNPDANCWLYDYFYLRHINGTLPPNIKYVHSVIEDNPYFDDDYKQTLRELPTAEYNRLYLGLWVAQSNTNLIEQSKLDLMFKPVKKEDLKPTHISADIARFGLDATIICVWSDLTVVDIIRLKNNSTKESADEIKKLMALYGLPANKVAIDANGIGAGTVDNINGCIPIDNSATAINKENFYNLKTQLYYKFAELADQITINCDLATQTQIKKEFGAIERIIKNDDKWKITPKDDVKKKLSNKSPDYSDALVYGMYFHIQNKYTGIYHFGY